MRYAFILGPFSLMLATLIASGSAAPAYGLTVVELFQSEGCSSCPPAEAILDQIADRPDVLALSFAVTYWDYLGWKDKYGSAAFTQRQHDYARASGRDSVYTPQMVFNGRQAIVGARRANVEFSTARRPCGDSLSNDQ